jgi:hypothetical protein
MGETVHLGRICELCHEKKGRSPPPSRRQREGPRLQLGGILRAWLQSSLVEAAKALGAMGPSLGTASRLATPAELTRCHFYVAPRRGLRCPKLACQNTGEVSANDQLCHSSWRFTATPTQVDYGKNTAKKNLLPSVLKESPRSGQEFSGTRKPSR